MDFALTEEQRRIQQMARAFAREELAPLAREADEQRVFPRELIPRMAELGFLSGTVAQEYGGAGMDALSFALVSEELGWADSSVRGFMTVHASLVSGCIEQWGTEEQKRAWLPKLASGDAIGCYCLTEPEAGSDVASMRMTCREDGDDVRAGRREDLDHQRQPRQRRARLRHARSSGAP